MSFRDEYLRTPPGPARDTLAFNALIAQGPPKNLTPVTVPGPGGVKITYKVMPDYLMVDGIRVSIPPAMAQQLAHRWGMSLPTAKMSKQIYNAANTKIRATPLSSSGYTGIDGKHYSPKDVISSRIDASDASVRYNDLTNQELQGIQNPGLIAGHGKDILEPLAEGKDVSLGGWQGKDGNALQPWTVAHKGEAGNHTEYGLWTRLVANNDVTVTTPDGKVIKTTMDKLRSNPNLAHAIAASTDIKQYKGTSSPKIGGPLPGYIALPENEKTHEIGQIATSLLKGEFGKTTPFTSNGKQYIGRVEPHFHPYPPPGADLGKYPKPWGWHKGVTVYKAKDAIPTPPPSDVSSAPSKSRGRLSLLQRIDSILDQFKV
jgi:hypothetical protein